MQRQHVPWWNRERYAVALWIIPCVIYLWSVVWTDLPLFGDGAFYFFMILDQGTPLAVFGRTSMIPLEFPVLLVRRFTEDIQVLIKVFSLSVAIVPLGAIAASWLVARHQQNTALLWPVLGIGFATLPGQHLFVGEAAMACQLGWPLLLALSMPQRGVATLIAYLVPPFLIHMHPIGIGLLILASGYTFILAYFDQQRRAYYLWMSVYLGLLSAFAVHEFMTGHHGSEQELASLSTIWFGMESTGILALGAVGLSIAAAGLFTAVKWSPVVIFINVRLPSMVFSALLVFSLLLFNAWAVNPENWMWAGRYRWLVAFATLPLMMAAALDMRRSSKFAATAQLPGAVILAILAVLGGVLAVQVGNVSNWYSLNRIAFTLAVIGLMAGVALVSAGKSSILAARQQPASVGAITLAVPAVVAFVSVLTIQSFQFSHAVSQFRMLVEQAPGNCVTRESERWSVVPPLLDSYELTVRSMLIQGRRPEKFVLYKGESCSETLHAGQFRIHPNIIRQRNSGWFDLDRLQPPS